MAEKHIEIPVGAHSLEAAYQSGSGQDTAILSHPHPLYGGSMDNNVVIALSTTLNACGWTTLRFNFRGVGSSGGHYGDGFGETEDLKAVIDHLRQEGAKHLHLAGYSFGAWITLKAVDWDHPPASLCLVSPPLGFLDFSNLPLGNVPTLITLGDSDSFCSTRALHEWVAERRRNRAELRVEIMDDCDHFYWGRENLLKSSVERFVSSLGSSSAA